MNVISVSLIIISLAMAVTLSLVLIKKSLLAARIKLYEEITKRTSVRKFLAILDKVDKKVINPEMALALEKYFELVLRNIGPDLVPIILADLQKSKHAKILQSSFNQAVIKTSSGFIGLAFVKNLDNAASRTLIQACLSALPEQYRKKEYRSALDILDRDHSENLIYYPEDRRMLIKSVTKELKSMELV